MPKLEVTRSGDILVSAQPAATDGKEDTAGANRGAVTGATPRRAGPVAATRTGVTTAEDALVDDLELDDFSFDFDDIEIPTEKLSDEDLKRHADEFMARILD
ncbi:hypothetical protein D9M72_592310 [compost metagenome]